MRTTSPHHADVFSHLPALLMRELDTPEVAEAVERLIGQGWRAGQLRHRVGAEPAHGTVAQDAAHLLQLLRSLDGVECPDARHERQRAEQRAARERAAREAPPVADPEVRDRWLTEIRSGLKGRPARREPAPERARPACALCSAESTFFVRRDVHLCGRCVDVLASGSASLTAATG